MAIINIRSQGGAAFMTLPRYIETLDETTANDIISHVLSVIDPTGA